ncbi:SRPBCC family protein [Spongiibacter sp.]|uniref:SRPBCC family protein n=1 Tax=Spongiibacter sp. TaxID=2024860 RepID=UPI00356407E6
MNHEASARVVIDMPRELAWELLKDLSLAHHYVPGVLRCELHEGPRQGLGASRRVYQKMGRWMDETVTEWNEGSGFVIRLHRGDKGPSAPFKQAQFRYRLEDAGHGQTALTTSLVFDMRWGALGRSLYRRLMAGAFRGIIRDISVSMKAFYESRGLKSVAGDAEQTVLDGGH